MSDTAFQGFQPGTLIEPGTAKPNRKAATKKAMGEATPPHPSLGVHPDDLIRVPKPKRKAAKKAAKKTARKAKPAAGAERKVGKSPLLAAPYGRKPRTASRPAPSVKRGRKPGAGVTAKPHKISADAMMKALAVVGVGENADRIFISFVNTLQGLSKSGRARILGTLHKLFS